MMSMVTLAVRKYLVPYRTQKSSRQTPTIVNAKIGSCQTKKKHSFQRDLKGMLLFYDTG